MRRQCGCWAKKCTIFILAVSQFLQRKTSSAAWSLDTGCLIGSPLVTHCASDASMSTLQSMHVTICCCTSTSKYAMQKVNPYPKRHDPNLLQKHIPLSPWSPCTLLHSRAYAPHSSFCCTHIQVVAVHSSISPCIYMFAIWSNVAPIGHLLYTTWLSLHIATLPGFRSTLLHYRDVAMYLSRSGRVLHVRNFARLLRSHHGRKRTIATNGRPKSTGKH